MIDPGGRALSWVRAGHDPALIYDPVTNSFSELGGAGTVLGLDRDAVYHQYRQADLTPGQIIVLGTDGIWEAQSPEGEMYGKKRLEKLIAQYHQAGARDIMLAILSALDNFQQGRPAEDDITVIIVKISDPANHS